MKIKMIVLLLVAAGACASSSCAPFVYGTAGTITFHEDDDVTPAAVSN